MRDRIDQELALLRKHYERVEYVPEGRWVLVWPVRTADGWSRNAIPVAFQIPVGYAGTPPYGFYAPSGLTFRGQQPRNYNASPAQPPFEGSWGMFSWQHEGGWRATGDLVSGSNLLNWTLTFPDRFADGA